MPILDDAPLEERRTQAVMSRRWLSPETASDLGRLDADAIARVRAEAWPEAANADELHDALVWLGFLTAEEVRREPRLERLAVGACAPEARGTARCAGRDALDLGGALAAVPGAVADGQARARDRRAGRPCRPGLVARRRAGRDRARTARGAGTGHARHACCGARLDAERHRQRRWRRSRPKASPCAGASRREPTPRSGASAGCSPAFTTTPSSGCGRRSSRSRRAISCASC